MSIQKKSLISTLKTAKKANVASAPLAHVEAGTTEPRVGKHFSKTAGKLLARSAGKSLSKVAAKHYSKSAARSYGQKK